MAIRCSAIPIMSRTISGTCGDLDVEAMVFLECYADFWEGGGQYIEEIEFVEDEAEARSAHQGDHPDGAA